LGVRNHRGQICDTCQYGDYGEYAETDAKGMFALRVRGDSDIELRKDTEYRVVGVVVEKKKRYR